MKNLLTFTLLLITANLYAQLSGLENKVALFNFKNNHVGSYYINRISNDTLYTKLRTGEEYIFALSEVKEIETDSICYLKGKTFIKGRNKNLYVLFENSEKLRKGQIQFVNSFWLANGFNIGLNKFFDCGIYYSNPLFENGANSLFITPKVFLKIDERSEIVLSAMILLNSPKIENLHNFGQIQLNYRPDVLNSHSFGLGIKTSDFNKFWKTEHYQEYISFMNYLYSRKFRNGYSIISDSFLSQSRDERSLILDFISFLHVKKSFKALDFGVGPGFNIFYLTKDMYNPKGISLGVLPTFTLNSRILN